MKSEAADIKEEVRAYLAKTFPHGKEPLGDDESLFEKGILDSLGFLQMLGFLGRKYKVTFAVTQIAIENFDTLNKIAASIIRKRNPER